MTEAGYPDLAGHVALHRELVRKTSQLSAKAGKDQDPDMILKFLKEWWLGHINTHDRKYAPFLKKLIDR
jgi:hemerythrin-like metal-binding protein